jgi:hypothetical protein
LELKSDVMATRASQMGAIAGVLCLALMSGDVMQASAAASAGLAVYGWETLRQLSSAPSILSQFVPLNRSIRIVFASKGTQLADVFAGTAPTAPLQLPL